MPGEINFNYKDKFFFFFFAKFKIFALDSSKGVPYSPTHSTPSSQSSIYTRILLYETFFID